ncbi:MAG TPA: universal stress protein [Minicystis sp.]|nr:universal stress protein [Minicystis sp.]
MPSFRHVLVATDFSECSRTAEDMAATLAEKFGARLTVAHVFEPPVQYDAAIAYLPIDDLRDVASKSLDDELARLRERAPKAERAFAMGTAWRELLGLVERAGADLVVVGTHGRRGVSRALLGSVAEKIVRLSPVPVLTVHGSAERPK